MDFMKLLKGTILYGIIAQIIHIVGSIITMDFYLMPEYFSVWSKIMMPTAGPPPVEFFYVSTLFALITGLLITFVFLRFHDRLKGDWKEKAMEFTLLVSFVYLVPMLLMTVLLINLPLMLLIAWVIEGLIIILLFSLAMTKFIA